MATAAWSDESQLRNGGSTGGRASEAAAALRYSASASSRASSVTTEAASGCGMSRWTVGLSGPMATFQAPIGREAGAAERGNEGVLGVGGEARGQGPVAQAVAAQLEDLRPGGGARLRGRAGGSGESVGRGHGGRRRGGQESPSFHDVLLQGGRSVTRRLPPPSENCGILWPLFPSVLHSSFGPA